MRVLDEIFFQLKDTPAGTEAVNKHKSDIRIIMFLSFRLEDVETRYTTIEQESLIIIKSLAEVRWLVVGNKYLIKIYIDYFILKSILRTGDIYRKITR